MNKFLMDAHMHFDLYKSRQKILDYIESNGSYTIAVTNLPELYERYYQQYDQYKYIKIALGFHPELVFQYMRQIEVFRKLVTTTRYIGEVGLDFTIQDNANRNAQRNIFSEIIDVCNEHSNKILSVHSRRAEKECLEVLKRYKGKTILHWYSGNINILSEAIERDYFFSINHQMLLSNNGRKIIECIPIEQILIESDAPFTKGLASTYSIDFEDKIYNYLAEKNGYTVNELSQIIKNNFRRILT